MGDDGRRAIEETAAREQDAGNSMPLPVSTRIHARERDLGGLSVRRILPAGRTRSVGPFVFLDHMGPAQSQPGHAVDVRPHPHINLATVTYLFAGEMLHRDSLGCEQLIRPGAVNLMIAGRGIVHSERTTPAVKASGQLLHGIQLWLGLPTAHEEDPPSFHHYPAESIPRTRQDGVEISVILGTAYGVSSPVPLPMETLYAALAFEPGGSLILPECAARALYVVEGEAGCDEERAVEGDMLVFRQGASVKVDAPRGARAILVGGAMLDGGERQIWWNFVSSRAERIEQAKRDWRDKRFPLVPGDEQEFIPLPE